MVDIREPLKDEVKDAVVVGAGFGGLGAALGLVEHGARVVVCETLRYAGGCASTFTKDGYAFDAGATLLSGLGESQLFGRWQRQYALGVDVEWLDPLVELRTPSFRLAVPRERDALVARFAALPGAPTRARALSAFFATQRKVADALWPLFDDPSLLPPFDLRALARHARRGPEYLALLGLVGKPLTEVVAAHGLLGFEPLRVYLDAVCQITVQCSAAVAEAPFALAALDYFFRGTGHVKGGVGVLATALARVLTARGAEVHFSNAVQAVTRAEDGLFHVRTRRGVIRARAVVANVLPRALERLLGTPLPAPTSRLAAEVEGGWGAAMLYLGARVAEGVPRGAHHLELVADTSQPFERGNHLFVSLSGADEGRAPAGQRAITVSTHVPLPPARGRGEDAQGMRARMEAVTASMQATLAALAPEVWEARMHVLTASPRTFARFTGRPLGAVGGVPRRAGLAAYGGVGPHLVDSGLWLVGDSVFPGQSALAAAIGGLRTAESVARALNEAA